MTIVPAPGKLPGRRRSFSGTRGEGRTERGDGFPPLTQEKTKESEQTRLNSWRPEAMSGQVVVASFT